MCTNRRNPIQCIIPPYIIEKMVDSGKIKLGDVLDNKLRNYRFRSDRKFFSGLPKTHQKIMVLKKAATKPKPVIEIYNCGHSTKLPGKLIPAKSIAKSKNNDVKNVFAGANYTWDFYYKIFNRNSIDNEGMALINSIHYGKKYNNAMWNGRQMIYGDGDGIIFDSFTVDIDIIGHELTHGVTQYSANLDYENQSGALNESWSDIMGIMIKQYALKQDVNQSNWLIGENVMKGKQYALRSMIAPGSAFKNHPQWGDDPQPSTMDKYINLPNTEEGDWGGVHYNSGIPNYAFCMAAKEMGGNSWEFIGKVFYAALVGSLKHDAKFVDAKNATIDQARRLFPNDSRVERAVVNGWAKAKV